MGVNTLTPGQPLLVRGIQDMPLGLSTSQGTGRLRKEAHCIYNFAVDGGSTAAVINPAFSANIPANAIITNVVIVVTTAVTGTTGGTIAIGVSNTLVAGTAASCLLAATAIASFTPAGTPLAGAAQGTPPTTWVLTTTSGNITVTLAVHPLTAGVIEIIVDYYIAKNAL